jgi:ribosomal protein L30
MRALGFTKLHQSKEVVGTPQIMGMINKVAHLLKIEKL